MCAFMLNPFFLGRESMAGKQLGISNVASGLFLSSKASTFWFNNTG